MADTSHDCFSDNKPFLTKEEKEEHIIDIHEVVDSYGQRSSQFFRHSSKYVFLLELLLLLIFTVGNLVYHRRIVNSCNLDHTLVHSPAREALQYEQKKFLLTFQESPFAGDPRPELDRAWHELLEPINIRVSSEDLRINNLTSVDLPGNKGSLAQLGVWHELHCIKIVRQWLRKDFYHPNLSRDQEIFWTQHSEHCLELFREAAMCRADISLTTFQWGEDDPRPQAEFLSFHDCVNWDNLVTWAKDRVVDGAGMGELVNPVLAQP